MLIPPDTTAPSKTKQKGGKTLLFFFPSGVTQKSETLVYYIQQITANNMVIKEQRKYKLVIVPFSCTKYM